MFATFIGLALQLSSLKGQCEKTIPIPDIREEIADVLLPFEEAINREVHSRGVQGHAWVQVLHDDFYLVLWVYPDEQTTDIVALIPTDGGDKHDLFFLAADDDVQALVNLGIPLDAARCMNDELRELSI